MNPSQKEAQRSVAGGYECAGFVELPQKGFQYECPICLLILREPHENSCCGYNYCKTCLDSVLNKTCPMCKQEKFTVFHNKGMERSLNCLHVRCVNEKSGCTWKGLLGEYTKHLNENPTQEEQLKGCDFTEVSCVYCNASFKRNAVCKHQNKECKKRPYSCEFCCHHKTYDDVVNKHWDICPFKPVTCPMNCGKSPQRQNIDAHVNDDCPLTVVKCDFHYAGCQDTLPRKGIPEHLTKELVPHLRMLASKQKKYEINHEQQLKDLKREIKDLKQRLTGLQQSLKTTEERLTTELETASNAIRRDLKQADDRLTKEIKTLEEKLRADLKATEVKLRNEVLTTQKTLQKDISSGDEEIRKELTESEKTLRKAITAASGKLEKDLATAVGAVRTELEALDEKLGKSIKGTSESLQKEINDLEQRLQVIVKTEKDKLQEKIKTTENKLSTEMIKFENGTKQKLSALQAKQKSVVPYVGMEPLKHVEVTMQNYQGHKTSNQVWYSPPFYSHLHGHKFYLSVTIQQSGNISVYVHLTRGEFGYALKRIQNGKITIQLVNEDGICQSEVSSPISNSVLFNCISNEMVWNKPAVNFTRGDCLRFRVTKVNLQ